MSDDVDQKNSSLTTKKKKIQMIKKITVVIIIVIRTANLINISVTVVLAVINVNNKFSK